MTAARILASLAILSCLTSCLSVARSASSDAAYSDCTESQIELLSLAPHGLGAPWSDFMSSSSVDNESVNLTLAAIDNRAARLRKPQASRDSVNRAGILFRSLDDFEGFDDQIGFGGSSFKRFQDNFGFEGIYSIGYSDTSVASGSTSVSITMIQVELGAGVGYEFWVPDVPIDPPRWRGCGV